MIYDTDMDVDDTSTLAYLCELDRRGLIDLLGDGSAPPSTPSPTS